MECLPSPAAFANSFKEYPRSDSPSETAYNLGAGHKNSFFDLLKKDPERASRFNKAMKGLAKLTQAEEAEDAKAFPWDTLGKGAKVVDVAGGSTYILIIIQSPPDRLLTVNSKTAT